MLFSALAKLVTLKAARGPGDETGAGGSLQSSSESMTTMTGLDFPLEYVSYRSCSSPQPNMKGRTLLWPAFTNGDAIRKSVTLLTGLNSRTTSAGGEQGPAANKERSDRQGAHGAARSKG